MQQQNSLAKLHSFLKAERCASVTKILEQGKILDSNPVTFKTRSLAHLKQSCSIMYKHKLIWTEVTVEFQNIVYLSFCLRKNFQKNWKTVSFGKCSFLFMMIHQQMVCFLMKVNKIKFPFRFFIFYLWYLKEHWTCSSTELAWTAFIR